MPGKESNVFHRRLDYRYPTITHGKGIYLYDESGRRYLDGAGGAFVATLGHGHPQIAARIARLAKKTSFLHAAQFTTRHMETYARDLCRIAPKGLHKVYFVSGGSEATETAIKLARQYHYDAGRKERTKIVYTWPSYHGATIGALSVSGKRSFRAIAAPYLLRFPSFQSYSSYRCPHDKKKSACTVECAYELEKTIRKNGPATVAAFIIEPIVGASGGVLLPPPGYFKTIRNICDRYGVLLIVDEVMTGFGRTGKWFASEHFNIKPDILTTAKGISGGFVPLAAVFCTEKIYRTIKRGTRSFLHGFTFANNQFTTGVGGIVLEYMKRRRLVLASARKGRYLLSRLKTLLSHETVGDVRGKGLFAAVEFVQSKKTKKPFPRSAHLAEQILQTAQKKGLMLYFSIGGANGTNGDVVMVGPPFIITKKEIDTIVTILGESVTEVERTLLR